MPKALIAGMGIQGVAIAYGLSVLGYDVTGIDISAENIDSASKLLGKLGIKADLMVGDATKESHISKIKPDVFVSALPFHLNFPLAQECIDQGVRYCDLGGNVDTSEKIRNSALKSAKVAVTTDLGLAPGFANNIAEMGYQALKSADSVKIRVGGLPYRPKGTLKYGMTFNPQGLYNEYIDDCLVIRDGKKKVVQSLSELESFNFEGVGDLVAFTTSGGIANLLDSMIERNVRECDYKTIRFPGHVEIIRFLLFESNMDLATFSKVIMDSCGFITEDQVLIQVVVSSPDGSRWEKKCRVIYDENFTAMQKTTGFGAAAVAAILGSGAMDEHRYASYADVPMDQFRSNINRLIPELKL
jgi:saccharopine dehydrogenase-like NADP-dependent oxidoreductase